MKDEKNGLRHNTSGDKT